MVDPQVLVIGAGPVGLVMATQLLRQGVPTRLIDKLEQPSLLSRAVGIHARSLEMFESMRVIDEFIDIGRQMTATEMWDGNKVIARIPLDVVASRYPFVLDLPQDRTEALLTQNLVRHGGTVERGVALVELSQSEDQVQVSLRHGNDTESRTEDLEVRWVVGCDGGHSTVRELLGVRLVGSFKGTHFVLADVDVDTDLDLSVMSMFAHRDGMTGVFPLPGDRMRLFIQVATPPADGAAPTIEETQALVNERVGPRVEITDSRWLTYFEVHHGQVPHYRYGRAFLAGDAAHVHSPAGGQGMNTGMQDAHNLAWKLALVSHDLAQPDLLDSYEAERHPVGASVVRLSTRAGELAASTNSIVRHARRFMLGWIAGHDLVRDSIAKAVTEVGINYCDSPIVAAHIARRRHGGSGQPGYHLPDVGGLVRGDGGRLHLTELLDPDRHTLVFVRSPAATPILGADPAEQANESSASAVSSASPNFSAFERFADVVALVDIQPDGPHPVAGSIEHGDDPPTRGLTIEVVVDRAGAAWAALGEHDDNKCDNDDVVVVVRPEGYIGAVVSPPDPVEVEAYFNKLSITF